MMIFKNCFCFLIRFDPDRLVDEVLCAKHVTCMKKFNAEQLLVSAFDDIHLTYIKLQSLSVSPVQWLVAAGLRCQ